MSRKFKLWNDPYDCGFACTKRNCIGGVKGGSVSIARNKN